MSRQIKQFAAAWSAYVAVTFVLGFVWHLVLFKQLYHDLGIFTRIDDPIIPLGLSAMVVQGVVLAYAYPLLGPRCAPLRDGIVFGLVAGLFIASSAVLAEAAKQKVSSLPTWLIVETVYYALQFGLSGAAIGLIYGSQATTDASR